MLERISLVNRSGALFISAVRLFLVTIALGFINPMRDLPDKSTKGGMLYVSTPP